LKPESGQQVKIIFRNGHSAEGIVLHWGVDLWVLRGLINADQLLIYSPLETVQMVQILLSLAVEPQPPTPQRKDLPRGSLELPGTISQPPVPRLSEPEPQLDLRNQKLAQLRQLQIQAHQEQIKNELRTFTLDTPTKTEYGTITQLGPLKRAQPKTSIGQGDHAASLPRLQAQRSQVK